MRILALHGMTLCGATMRRQMGRLRAPLEKLAEVEWLDAPHECPVESVQRHYAAWGLPIPDGPHLRWWNAKNHGREYAGWEVTRAALGERIEAGTAPLLLGFSQGAIAATAVAIESARGRLPPIAGVIAIAGAPPRAPEIIDHAPQPLPWPSLHIWGRSDTVTGKASPELVAWYAPTGREVVTWPGPHVVPRRGEPTEKLLQFVERLSRRTSGGG